MKYKTIAVDQASGPALDWLVAKAEGVKDIEFSYSEDEAGAKQWWCFCGAPDGMPGYVDYTPTRDWNLGGRIMGREFINTTYDEDWVYDPSNHDPDDEPDNGDRWLAWLPKNEVLGLYGPTQLVAAMRAYVRVKLGPSAKVPKELCP